MSEKKSKFQAFKEMIHMIEISLDPDLMIMCEKFKDTPLENYYNEEHEITMQEYADALCGEAKKRGVECVACDGKGSCKRE